MSGDIVRWSLGLNLAFLLWCWWDFKSPVALGPWYLHARYGLYQKVVEYSEGMTLYPRQQAVGAMRIPLAPRGASER